MGREVRMVPVDWQHPKDEKGHYIPLHSGSWAERHAEWLEAHRQWQNGFRENYRGDGPKFVPKDDDDTGTYTEYAGGIPSPDDYMPDWPADQRTHYMMYEDTSEGTPISPAFETPEELARWLADNGASAFGGMTASYEHWLSVARGGFAPSMVIDGGKMMSGVEFAGSAKP